MQAAAEARGRAQARAALLGNPSDGFGGKTISVTLSGLAAEVVVRPAERLDISADDAGGARLIRAALNRFAGHCREIGREFDGEVAVSYETTVPRQVGLGGSSAIVIAALRALAAHLGIGLESDVLARLALAAETQDLGIPAGPQDRVVQAHGGLVYMDFDRSGGWRLERLDPALLPPLFVAYRADASEPSAAVHTDHRARFERGDRELATAMGEIAELAERGREALLAGRHPELGKLMSANVAARARIVGLDPRHARMVELAESLGAPANYAGSGGAVVGIVPAGGVEGLREAFAREDCEVVEAP